MTGPNIAAFYGGYDVSREGGGLHWESLRPGDAGVRRGAYRSGGQLAVRPWERARSGRGGRDPGLRRS